MTAIREGRPADLLALRRIQSAALSEPSPDLLPAAATGPLSLFVLTDGEPLGYAIVVGDGESVGYIPEIAVAPDFQGQSYGSQLLSHVVTTYASDGYDQLRLTVRADDDRARSFYDDHGFERRKRLPDYFESGDALLLVRSLE